jgi:hypothetical protein
MKSPESVLRSVLVDNATTCILVGNRIYPTVAPSTAALPFIAYRRSGIQRDQAFRNPVGMPRVSVEFVTYGATYNDARDVADAVRSVLDGYGGTVNNTVVDQVSLENETDDFVTLAGADLPPVYQITQTYDIRWQES